MKTNFRALQVIALVASLSFLAIAQVKTIEPGSAAKWYWSFSPVSKRGIADAPVQIVSLAGGRKNGGTIAGIGLFNKSGKTVEAIKFTWVIYREESPLKTLADGETPMIGVGDLAANSKRKIDYPLFSIAKDYPMLMKEGNMEGEFATELSVKEILYDDGTKWERK